MPEVAEPPLDLQPVEEELDLQPVVTPQQAFEAGMAPIRAATAVVTNPAAGEASAMGREQTEAEFQAAADPRTGLPKFVYGEGLREPTEKEMDVGPSFKQPTIRQRLQNIPVIGRVFEPTKLPYEIEQEAGEELPPQTAVEGAARGVRNLVGGVVKPESLALIGATGGVGLSESLAAQLAARAGGLYFAGEGVKGATEATEQALAPGRTLPQRIQSGVEALGSGATALLGTKQAIEPITVPIPERVRFARAKPVVIAPEQIGEGTTVAAPEGVEPTTSEPTPAAPAVRSDPAAIAEELGITFDGNPLGRKDFWQFTLKDKAGKGSTTIIVPEGSTLEAVRAKHEAKVKEYEGEAGAPAPPPEPKPKEVVAGETTHTELSKMSDADAAKFFDDLRKAGIAAQYDSVLAGMKLGLEAVPELERLRDETGALMKDPSTFQDPVKMQAAFGRNVWYSGAIEGANRKGPNYDAVVSKRTPAPAAPTPPAPAEPKPPLGPLLEVPKTPKGLAAERQQIVRALKGLEEADPRTGVLYPKEGKEDTVKRLRARLATIEQALLPPKPAPPTVSQTAPIVPPNAPIVAQTPPSVAPEGQIVPPASAPAPTTGPRYSIIRMGDGAAQVVDNHFQGGASVVQNFPGKNGERLAEEWVQQKSSPPPSTNIPPATAPPTKPAPTATVEVPEKQKAGFDAKQAKAQKKFLLSEVDKAHGEALDELPVVEADADAAIVDKLRRFEAGDTKETFEAKREAQLPALFSKYQIPEGQEARPGTLSQSGLPLGNSLEAMRFSMDHRFDLLDRAIAKARFQQLPKIVIEVPGDGEFTIVNSKAALEAFREQAKDFPTTAPRLKAPSTPRESATAPAALGKLDAASVLKAAGTFTSDDPHRFALLYVLSDGKSTVATDGRHLIKINKSLGGTKAKPLIQTPDGKKPPVQIAPEKEGGKPTTFKYPDYTQVIPKDSDLKPIAKDVDAARLFTILKQAEQVLTERSNSVRLYRNPDGSIGATAESPGVGEYAHNIQDDTKLIGAFNPQYVIDALNAARMIGDEKVSFESTQEAGKSELDPVVIRSKNMMSVVMPMLLSSLEEGAEEFTGEEPPPDYSEIGHGDETGDEMRGTTLTAAGLPPNVPDRGPGFAAELLEASRQLDALVRYRGTLRPGVLGQFVRARSAIGQADRIEVGDIHNQGTVAHEIGHALDGTLWPAIFAHPSRGSQRSLADRAKVPGATGKDLQKELAAVSELMRGPITGSPGHQKYRKSAVELIADYFSLYLHDPAMATRMAPKWTEGMERALANVPDAQGVVTQLHSEEGLTPQTGPEKPGPAATPTPTPGALPAKPKAAPVPRDAPLVTAAENLVKGEVRKYEEKTNRARVVADRWRKLVPNRNERADVGAFIEGIGNVEIPGDDIAAVRSRMTPAMNELAKTYRDTIEFQRQEINGYLKFLDQGDYLKFLEDYLPHFYANGRASVQSVLSRFMKESPNAKRRTIPTLQEATEYGLIPITQDPAALYEHTARINWRVATNRALLGHLKDMRTTGGDPVVVPAKDAPPGWAITSNPLVQQVYARPTASGDLLLWRGGAAIHPDAWRAVRQMLDTPTSSELARAYDALNSFTRANAFAFSLFHDITLRSAAAGQMMRWYNPARGLFRLFERNPVTGELEMFRGTRGVGKELLQDEEAVADAALHGLKFSWTESETYQKNARDFLERLAARWREHPLRGGAAAFARDLQHMRQQGLWKNTHDAYKIIAYHDLTAKALQDAPPGTNPKVVKETIASLLNDAFGGQEWQTKFWLSPQARMIMSRFFLAPDWTLSTIRSVPGTSDAASVVRGQAGRFTGRGPMPTGKEGAAGNFARARFWGGEIAALAMATLAAQYAIYKLFGDNKKGDKPWVWENEEGQNRRVDATPLMRKLPWHDPKDPTRYYVNLGKRPEEILSWFTRMDQQIMSKMSRPAAEVFRQVTGTEGDFKAQWKRDHESFVESIPARAKSALGQAIPFTFSGNQFALSLPYRKGMTRYKAQQAYESAFEIMAEPSRWRMIVRSGHGNPQALIDLVTDAAHRNGVPAEEVEKRAASIVRGKYYGDYFKAFKAGDQKALDKAAQALERLSATASGMQKSMQRREKMEPRLPAASEPSLDLRPIAP